jgi:WhiB family redox-sensing transcriptional regulator
MGNPGEVFHRNAHEAPYEEWMSDPNPCKPFPTEMFFPEHGSKVREPVAICFTCPNRTSCLNYALDNHIQHGIWGGQNERARRRILAARRLAS